MAVSLAVVHRVIRSPFGRVLTTIRDNPERAAFLGINVRLYQLAAFVVAGGLAGLAGALYGIFSAASSPITCSGRSRPNSRS